MTSGLEERIGTLLAQHRSELEQLVDQALERELAQLVEQRLAVRNGDVREPEQHTRSHVRRAESTKVCTGPCGRELPVSRFETGRGKCRDCRRAEVHEREQRRAAEQAEPTEPERPAAYTREIERWLVDERLAEQTLAGLVATVRGLELAAGIN